MLTKLCEFSIRLGPQLGPSPRGKWSEQLSLRRLGTSIFMCHSNILPEASNDGDEERTKNRDTLRPAPRALKRSGYQ